MSTVIIVKIPAQTLEDLVVSVGGATYTQQTAVSALPTISPLFFWGKDIDGADIVCAVKGADSPLKCNLLDAGGNVYSVVAELAPPTVIVDFVGGRPDDRR